MASTVRRLFRLDATRIERTGRIERESVDDFRAGWVVVLAPELARTARTGPAGGKEAQ